MYYQSAGTSGAVLGANSIRQVYPTFQLIDDPSMTTEALCFEVRKNRQRSEVKDLIRTTTDIVERDPAEALQRMANAVQFLQGLGSGRKTDHFASDCLANTLRHMELKKQGYDMSVCSWPWAPLQNESGGIQPDDYVVFYGRPKSMKSWVLSHLISHTYSRGKRVLIYTKEMTPDNIFARVGACLARIDYKRFRDATLYAHEEQAIYAVQRYLEIAQQQQTMVCLSGRDAGDGGDTVTWLRSKMELHKPDIVYIDGMYLMSDNRGHTKQKDNARVQNISRDLRRTVLDYKTPVICTLQANRDADKNEEANLSEIAFSDAIGQDATLAIRIINEKKQPTLALLLGGSREFVLDGFRIYGMPAHNFDDAGALTAAETQWVKAGDAPETDPAAAPPARKRKAAQAQPDMAESARRLADAMG
jgi:replicative DNA helicase